MTDSDRRLEVVAAVAELAWDCRALQKRVAVLEVANLELQQLLAVARVKPEQEVPDTNVF
jgi:hypothetical protein